MSPIAAVVVLLRVVPTVAVGFILNQLQQLPFPACSVRSLLSWKLLLLPLLPFGKLFFFLGSIFVFASPSWLASSAIVDIAPWMRGNHSFLSSSVPDCLTGGPRRDHFYGSLDRHCHRLLLLSTTTLFFTRLFWLWFPPRTQTKKKCCG